MPTTLIAASTPAQTETIGNEIIYVDPRISANQLSQFLVSGAAKQESIVKDARRVLAVRVANYQPARRAMPRCHGANGIDPQSIEAQAQRMRNAIFSDSFEERCNELSADAFDKFAPIASRIDCAGQRLAAPRSGYNHLLIEGVRVSVQPEIVFKFAHRGLTKVGGVIFNFSKGNQSSLENGNDQHKAGEYAAVLVFLMLGNQFPSSGPRNSNCFAVDVYRRKIFKAPASHKRMIRDMEAACRNIARQWSELSVVS